MHSLLSLNTRGGRAVGRRVGFSPSHLPFLIYRSHLPSVLRANPAVAFRTTSSILRSEQNGDNRAKAAKLSKEAKIGKVSKEVQLPSSVDG